MDNGASSYRRFLNGDDSGMVEILRDYKDSLTLYLNSYVGNIYTAEELMEETFFKIIIRKPRFSSKSSFKTWLFSIGRNMALDYIRRNSKISPLPIEDYEGILIEEQTVEKAYFAKEDKIFLHKTLSKLKPEHRQVLFLIYFENLKINEVALVLKKSKHQTENLVYRAKAALKSKLEKEGFVYERL